jgi:hypothetical protein
MRCIFHKHCLRPRSKRCHQNVIAAVSAREIKRLRDAKKLRRALLHFQHRGAAPEERPCCRCMHAIKAQSGASRFNDFRVRCQSQIARPPKIKIPDPVNYGFRPWRSLHYGVWAHVPRSSHTAQEVTRKPWKCGLISRPLFFVPEVKHRKTRMGYAIRGRRL